MPIEKEKKEALSKEIDKLFAEEDHLGNPYTDTYTEKGLQIVKDKMLQMLEEGNRIFGADKLENFKKRSFELFRNSESPEEFRVHANRMLRDVLPKCATAHRHLNNVERQKAEIQKVELNPGKIDVQEYASQIRAQIPYSTDPRNMGWNEWIEGYGTTGKYWNSYRGGTKEERRRILERDRPHVHTHFPDLSYRNLVLDCARTARDEVREADAMLDAGFQGRDLTEQERRQIHKKDRSEILNSLSNRAEYRLAGMQKGLDWLGRGIISKSKVGEDNRYNRYLEKRNEMLAQMIWKLSAGSMDYAKAAKLVNDALKDSGDIMDQATFMEVQRIITDELKKNKEVNEAELKRFNEDLQKANEAMINATKSQLETEDDAWKYRVMQMFLIMTPIGAFSLFGDVFSYIDPLAQLFGPIFDSSIGFGDGLAEMATSPVLGPFGKLADMMGVDEAIRWIFDEVPLISHAGDLIDLAMDNAIVGGALDVAGPAVFSPLVPVGIAGFYGLMHLDASVERGQKSKEMVEKHDKALKELFSNFNDELEKGRKTGKADDDKKGENLGLDARLRAFTDARMAAMKNANVTAEMAEFIANADPAALAIFGDLKCGEKGTKSIKHIRDEKVSPIEILKELEAHEESLKAARDKFLLFQAVADKGKTLEENLVTFGKKRTDEDGKKLIEKQKKKYDQACILRCAAAAGMSSDNAPMFLAEFVDKADAQALSIFDGLNFGSGKTMSQVKADRKTSHRIIEYIQFDPSYKEAMDRFLLLKAVSKTEKSFAENLEEFHKPRTASEVEKLCQDQQKKFNKISDENLTRKCTYLESRIKEDFRSHMRSVIDVPNPTLDSAMGKKMHGGTFRAVETSDIDTSKKGAKNHRLLTKGKLASRDTSSLSSSRVH